MFELQVEATFSFVKDKSGTLTESQYVYVFKIVFVNSDFVSQTF